MRRGRMEETDRAFSGNRARYMRGAGGGQTAREGARGVGTEEEDRGITTTDIMMTAMSLAGMAALGMTIRMTAMRNTMIVMTMMITIIKK